MIVGLDIGGTKIEGVALACEGFNEIKKLRVPTQKDSYQNFLNTVFSVLDQLAESGEIDSIGIGCCGFVGNDGLMQGANVLVLNGQDFIADVKARYPVPVTIANDADCLALSEFKDGAAKDANNSCVAIIIGTGCGSGVIVHEKLVTGLNKLGGELGHNPLPNFCEDVDGAPVQCDCGSMNCNEMFVSGSGFARTWNERYKEPLSSKEIMKRVLAGDLNAIAHFDLYCDQLARVCASIVNFIDPEVIVLGGGMSNVDDIYPLVNEKMDKYTVTKKTITNVVKNAHGDSSGIRGAAFLNE